MHTTLYTTARRVQDLLLSGPWPPARVLVDAWVSLHAWHVEGEVVTTIQSEARSPAIAPDLPLATAPVTHRGICYLVREQWIIVARTPPDSVIPVRAPERVLALKQPCLTYVTMTAAGGLASGYVNLVDQPTPRHLKIFAGISQGELGQRRLEAEEIAEEAVLLARVLPFFYHAD